jgi:uncharacterized damage-inducible protein DinB
MATADPQRWSNYSGSLRSVLDEYARAIREFEQVLLALPKERYDARTVLSDENFTAVRDILKHTIGAAHVYVDYLTDALDGTDRGYQKREFPYSNSSEALSSLWEAFDRMVDVLGRIKDWTDEKQEEIKFVTRWKQPFDIEQMLEHAIVHILRHRRQLERWRDAPLAG